MSKLTARSRALFAAAALSSAALFATPAAAAVNVNGTTLTANGSPITLTFNGSENGVVYAGVGSTLQLTYTGYNSTTNLFNFSYTLTNSSTAPSTGSRLVGFGFNVNPDANSNNSVATGLFNEVNGPGSYSSGANVEICILQQNGNGNTCSGGGNGGLTMGNSGTGTFGLSITGANANTNVSLTDFLTRYQAVNGTGSGIGQVTAAVPEPSTWALMLIGFGAVGFSMRRGRRATPRLVSIA